MATTQLFHPDATPTADAVDPSLAQILAAWESATRKLQQTHETLRREVGRLTDELEIKNRELARKNRLADLGQMASHVAHEVRNSLMPITLYLSMLRRRLTGDAETTDLMDKTDAGFQALQSTVNDLLHFTSDRQPHCESLRLHAVVDQVCQAIDPQLRSQRIETTRAIPADQYVVADGNMLGRALLNLALNALDVMPAGGQLGFACRRVDAAMQLTVSDTGPGLTPEARSRLFEPFFTTKREGTGLGLAIVERIVEAHGGRVRAENRADGGAQFTIDLPLSSTKEQP